MSFAMLVLLLNTSTKRGEKKRIKLRGYDSIVVQHEIDHTNGIMFYDRINKDNPFYYQGWTLDYRIMRILSRDTGGLD